MSTAALMMVRDEEDVIGATLDHLVTQVDQIYVLDNRSIDGTSEIIHDRIDRHGDVIRRWVDEVVAYNQSEKMTQLADLARRDGHSWVLPCDADEIWMSPEGNVAGFLGRLAPDVQIVRADLYDHMPTSADDAHVEPPQVRLEWCRVEPGGLPKVAARTHKALTIHPGNHGADYGRHSALAISGLWLHHFTWRNADQYLRKIRNGLEAYADVKRQDIGVHWRMHEGTTDAEIRDHFQTWFFELAPLDNRELERRPLERSDSGQLVEVHG